MITFTKQYTVNNPDGTVTQGEQKYRKMSDEMLKHYGQNPLGMDKIVRAHFGIPDDRYYSVVMWNPDPEMIGCLYVHRKAKSEK